MRTWLNETFGRGWVLWLLGGWLLVLLTALMPRGAGAQTEALVRPEVADGVTLRETRAVALKAVPAMAEVSGSVVDGAEAAVSDAEITLRDKRTGATLRATSGQDGAFSLSAVPVGEYELRVERDGFDSGSSRAVVEEGVACKLPPLTLKVAAVSSTLEVRASGHAIAEAQVMLEEQQRVLGVFPNFYASYVPDAEPLTARQKFQLAWRFVNDPVALGMAGVVAGSEQRADTFHAYGQGVTGYTKRYAAAYADGLTSTVIGQALLPAMFHQDPRYFVKGTGSPGSRVLYAMASMVICKGDNRHWQPNYSNVLGNFASAGLSNAYRPAAQRGVGLVVSNAMTATALGAVGGLFQEFVLHRMTPRVPEYGAVR